MTYIAECPKCHARYSGKQEHCPGGPRRRQCCLTFSSTRVGDRHLTDEDDSGWSYHRTAEEMRELRTKDGKPRYVEIVNPYGTPVWSRYDERTHPHAPVSAVEAPLEVAGATP